MAWRMGTAALAVALVARAARAATVTVSGEATNPFRPDAVRVRVLLTAEGKDVETAVAALAAKREAVRNALDYAVRPAGLPDGAAVRSVAFTATTVGGPALTPQQRQMQTLMGLQRGGNRKPPASQPTTVTVSTTMTAEYPVAAAKDDDAAAVAAVGSQATLRAAIAKATAGGRATTPEEQETAEESAMSASMAAMGATPAAKPGEPEFTFVHRLTADERAKVSADAVAKAAADADRLAKAAGFTVAGVAEVTSRAVATSGESDSPFAAILRAQTGQSTTPAAGDDEAVAAQPGAVTFGVGVTIKFDLVRREK